MGKARIEVVDGEIKSYFDDLRARFRLFVGSQGGVDKRYC